MNNKTILITGGCGFVGHHFVEHFIKNMPQAKIIVMDKLNYSGSLDRLRDISCYPTSTNVQVLTCDFSLPIADNVKSELKDVTHIIHMGAESHVDKSIQNPEPFVISNVLGTMHMLNLARELPKLEQFYYFSTDEVFGNCEYGASKENDPHWPRNPYAATKSAGDMLCRSYANTYGLPITTTQTMNVIGERQHPEKFVPMCIRKILNNEVVTIHSNKDKTKAGSRFYIHARNVADAYLNLINKGSRMSISNYANYNIVGEQEVDNLHLAEMIASILGKSLRYEMVDFHSSRPGHDLRYALDGTLIKSMYDWSPPVTFEQSLGKTVNWFINNPKWLEVKK
jgi:dTDP-glucose 4,6-dehydratase